MKKVVLILCVVAVSGFASSCAKTVSVLNSYIKDYNERCTGDLDFLAVSHCKQTKDAIDRLRGEIEYCREKRNDEIMKQNEDIVRKLDRYYR